MKNWLKKLLPRFQSAAAPQHEPANTPAEKPDPVREASKADYERGLNGTPAEIAASANGMVLEGAVAAVKAGRMANLYAYLTGLDFMTGEALVRNFREPPADYAIWVIEKLSGAEIAACLTPLAPGKKQALLDSWLNERCLGRGKGDNVDKIEALIQAGANVDNHDGLPLRLTADRGHTPAVRLLAKTGASFDIAIFGAEVNGPAGNETTRKLKIYEEFIRTGKMPAAEQAAAAPAVQAVPMKPPGG